MERSLQVYSGRRFRKLFVVLSEGRYSCVLFSIAVPPISKKITPGSCRGRGIDIDDREMFDRLHTVGGYYCVHGGIDKFWASKRMLSVDLPRGR